jgi:hypothetical protein
MALYSLPAVAIDFYNLRLGTVVVVSDNQQWTVGHLVDVTLPAEVERHPAQLEGLSEVTMVAF